MVEDYFAGRVRSKKSADARAKEIAISVHGEENWKQRGWPTNLGSEVMISDIAALYSALQENGPLYAYYWDGIPGDEGRAHLVVVTGVNLTENKVYTNNPWGMRGVQSYSNFEKGVAWYFGLTEYGMTLQALYLVNKG